MATRKIKIDGVVLHEIRKLWIADTMESNSGLIWQSAKRVAEKVLTEMEETPELFGLAVEL